MICLLSLPASLGTLGAGLVSGPVGRTHLAGPPLGDSRKPGYQREQRYPVTLLRTFLTNISSLVHRCLEESILVYI